MPAAAIDRYLQPFAGRRVTLLGPMLTATPPRRALEEPLIWVDGGADFSAGHGGLSVGDGDSARRPLQQRLPANKDYSDLAYVLRRLPGNFREVVLLGFLGGRRDHELFNFGEVHHFLAAKTHTQARFERAAYGYSQGEWRFCAHGVFSLATFAATTATLLGACEFPLSTPTEIRPLTSLGLSNRGYGDITLRAHGPVFIFHPNGASAE